MKSSYEFISFEPRWRISQDIWFLLGQCRSIVKAIVNIPIEPAYLRYLYQVSLRKGAQATTAIEGNTLSEEEIKQLQTIDAKLTPGGAKNIPPGKDYMVKEIENILKAMNHVRDTTMDQSTKISITPELILKFHRLIGEGLKENFEAKPGSFRRTNVVIGRYRPPDYEEVSPMIKRFCEWSGHQFHYERDQNFSTAILQAVVTHIYIALIHPFTDGNGRTARLLEFCLLMRGGVPDIAAHILSNHYNQTRDEYYRQLDQISRTNGDLSRFIAYAIRGFKDGLEETLDVVQKNQLVIAWRDYIHEVFRSDPRASKTKSTRNRQMALVISMEIEKVYTLKSLLAVTPSVQILYGSVSERTFDRDIQALLDLKLIRPVGPEGYQANADILRAYMPLRFPDEIKEEIKN